MRTARALLLAAAVAVVALIGWQTSGDRPFARANRLAAEFISIPASASPAFPRLLREAVVASDDPDFFRRAAWQSPITSAFARNALARSAPGLSAGEARLAAAFIAVRLDLSLDHTAILDLYLARAYYGAGCYGAETASLALFAVPLAKADDAQLLALAALPVFPSRTLRDPEARAARIDRILGTLVAEERLTPAEAERLAALAPAEIVKGSFCE